MRVEYSTGPISNPSTIYFVYDHQQILAILDDSSNLLALFTNGPNLDEPLIMRRDGHDYIYHQDALWNVVALTDIDGNIAETVEYAAYGLAVIKDAQGQPHTTSTIGNPYLWAGREWDEERGEYFHRNRQTYDPQTGRFGQEDPIGLTGGFNLYSYAQANPIKSTDPLGLTVFRCYAPLHILGAAGKILYYVPPLYHEYSCVVNKHGKTICGGQNRTGGPFSPGTPSQDSYTDRCVALPEADKVTEECIENCLLQTWAAPRPYYALAGGAGENCQSYDRDVYKKCLARCSESMGPASSEK